jgi:hypothetical protein
MHTSSTADPHILPAAGKVALRLKMSIGGLFLHDLPGLLHGCPHFTDALSPTAPAIPEGHDCGRLVRFSRHDSCLAGPGVPFSPLIDRLSAS